MTHACPQLFLSSSSLVTFPPKQSPLGHPRMNHRQRIASCTSHAIPTAVLKAFRLECEQLYESVNESDVREVNDARNLRPSIKSLLLLGKPADPLLCALSEISEEGLARLGKYIRKHYVCRVRCSPNGVASVVVKLRE